MKKIKKFIFPILLILCLAAGTVWQSVMTQIEKSKYCAVGNYVDVGTYQAHYYSKGSGDMAFVFLPAQEHRVPTPIFMHFKTCCRKEG